MTTSNPEFTVIMYYQYGKLLWTTHNRHIEKEKPKDRRILFLEMHSNSTKVIHKWHWHTLQDSYWQLVTKQTVAISHTPQKSLCTTAIINFQTVAIYKSLGIMCTEYLTTLTSFDALLTVHFSLFILLINQLDAQNFCFPSLFHSLYIFRAHVLIIRRSKLHYIAYGIITPIGGRLVYRLREDFSQPVHETATYRCDDTRGCVM